MSDTAPDLTEYVIGYRGWMLGSDDDLYPLIAGGPWKPGVNTAQCRPIAAYGYPEHDRDQAPHPDCHCGLYAYHDFAQGRENGTITGIVRAWGDMEVHGHGFRAERAEIVALVDQSLGTDISGAPILLREREFLARIAKRYGVPVVATGQAEAFAAEHGAPVPEQLRPAAQAELPPVIVSGITLASTYAGPASPGAWSRQATGWRELARTLALLFPATLLLVCLWVAVGMLVGPIALAATIPALIGGACGMGWLVAEVDWWLGARGDRKREADAAPTMTATHAAKAGQPVTVKLGKREP